MPLRRARDRIVKPKGLHVAIPFKEVAVYFIGQPFGFRHKSPTDFGFHIVSRRKGNPAYSRHGDEPEHDKYGE